MSGLIACKLPKIKFAVEFPLRRKQRKQNPSPEGTLVLLSTSEKSGGVWCSQLPCFPRPFVTGSGELHQRAPTWGPGGLRECERQEGAGSMRAASVKLLHRAEGLQCARHFPRCCAGH